MSDEYKKNCVDEIDWTEINQLHEATLQISKSCFEYKKICVGLLGATIAVLVKLTDGVLDHSYFVILILLTIGFWIADSTSYFYQKTTRKLIDQKYNCIALRNEINGDPRIITEPKWKNAFVNSSMALYYVLISLSILGWILFGFGVIGK